MTKQEVEAKIKDMLAKDKSYSGSKIKINFTNKYPKKKELLK